MSAIPLWVETACRWEATARKPGNVSPEYSFEDLQYQDFLASARAIAPVLGQAHQDGVGAAVRDAIRATRQVVGSNTNLGMVLLLAPLAAVPLQGDLRSGVEEILDALTEEDARLVYEAIRLAAPGGLGRVEQEDVNVMPTLPLRQIMVLAAERDLVARQYANGYREVFDEGVPALKEGIQLFACIEGAIVHCHLVLLSRHPDSLIQRKRGRAEAEEARRRASTVVALAGQPGWASAVGALDAWLRAQGNTRNPGTTADLVTACLFVALRTGILAPSTSLPWTAPSLLSKKEDDLSHPRGRP